MVHATVPRGAAKERVRKRDEEQERRNREEAARRREERVSAGQISGDPVSRARRERFQAPGELTGRTVQGKPERAPQFVSERDFQRLKDRILRPAVEVDPGQKEVLGEVLALEQEPLPEAEGAGIIPLLQKALAFATAPITTKAGEEISQASLFAATPVGRVAKGVQAGGKLVKAGKGLTIPVSNEALAASSAQKIVTTKTKGNIFKATSLAEIWKTKIGKAFIVGTVAQGLLEGYASALDAANMQMKEGISEGIISTMKKGGYGDGTTGAIVALGMIRQIEANVDSNEATIKLIRLGSIRALFFARFEPIMKRIDKIRIEFDEAKTDIRLFAANPIPPQLEQLGIVMDEIGEND